MDSLRSSGAPLQEYLLQGSILDSHCDLLLHRLNGLCDNTDSGPEKFHDQELVYTLRKYYYGHHPFICSVSKNIQCERVIVCADSCPWKIIILTIKLSMLLSSQVK